MSERLNVLVTGGAGFIGSALCRYMVGSGGYRVVNLDKLAYAGNLESLRDIAGSPDYRFVQGDVGDRAAVRELLSAEAIDIVVHLAAQTHVDRSIDGPEAFVEVNILGTFELLGAALDHWRGLPDARKARFRFHHVSTDEVFGDLPPERGAFTEESPYAPSSPYSASKAAADHLARAWHRTYGLPVVLSNCSNNYGPCQFPEKLVPLAILNALEGKVLPVYGKGENIRDWLHVEDHARALELIATRGAVGETYVVGGRAERSNLAVVETICDLLDARRPLRDGRKRRSLIAFVADRPGHDRRYAVDPSKIERELGWSARESFESGIAKTVDWYLANDRWWRPVRERQYSGERLGTG